MNAMLEVRPSSTRSVAVAAAVAIVGLAIVLFSVALGTLAADAAVRALGGAMEASRYELTLQLNTEAFRVAGAVLLAVGTFVALRRA